MASLLLTYRVGHRGELNVSILSLCKLEPDVIFGKMTLAKKGKQRGGEVCKIGG
jgi:hypothetical protein